MESITINIPLLKSLLSLATVIEAKDPYTGGHTWRVSRYARMLAEKAGLSQDEAYLIYFGSLVHDIGKVSVPEPILSKPDKLTAVELEIVQKHPYIGWTLVNDHPLGYLTVDIVASHHERYDGTGYPHKLAGDEINLFARIVSIADAFDAMTSTRPYRAGMTTEAACAIMEKESGTQFDPTLLTIFLEMVTKGQVNHILGHSSEERLLHTCSECGPIIVLPTSTQDGDEVICPSCRGIYDVHTSNDGFEVVWSGKDALAWVPEPDRDTISEIVRNSPSQIKVDLSAQMNIMAKIS